MDFLTFWLLGAAVMIGCTYNLRDKTPDEWKNMSQVAKYTSTLIMMVMVIVAWPVFAGMLIGRNLQ